MSTWINADVELGGNVGILTISDRALVRMGRLDVRDMLKKKVPPEEMEKVFYDIIEELRPEWAGGVLFGMTYSMFHLVWEFTYCHRAMPRKSFGEQLDKIPLLSEPVPEILEADYSSTGEAAFRYQPKDIPQEGGEG